LSAASRRQLRRYYLGSYDPKQGSWATDQKFLDWDSVEYSMTLAAMNNDTRAEQMARFTLAQQMHLLDPEWGGVYQYSAGSDWTMPHFEKIMQMQAENLRVYSLAYARWQDATYLHAAQEIRRYLKTFLTSPEGSFYTSQDADLIEGEHAGAYFALDDAQRRKLGIPRIDQHMYARENGWAIAGLATLYAASGDEGALQEALTAARWVLANRSLAGGGFEHGDKDAAGPYLGDSVAMVRALLALYSVTGDRQWLAGAETTMTFIGNTFRDPKGAGFLTVKAPRGQKLKTNPQRDENVMMARTANLLFHYTGKQSYQVLAQQAMRYLAAPSVLDRRPASSALQVDLELSSAPLHLTIVGPKNDANARKLFQAAVRYPSTYKRVEWWDQQEGPLPNPDVQYPALQASAAFICTDRSCSSPIFKAEELGTRVEKLARRESAGSIAPSSRPQR
jgi:uncharacterized protein YyaL (SSP411 family)